MANPILHSRYLPLAIALSAICGLGACTTVQSSSQVIAASADNTERVMIKAVFLLHKRSDMSFEEFRRYWRDVHGPIAMKIPGLKNYVQNLVRPEAGGSANPEDAIDGIAELWFDSVESLRHAQGTPEWQASANDAPNLFDTSRLRYYVVEGETVFRTR